MKDHPLFKIVKDYLEQPQTEVTIHPVNKKGEIPISITVNLPVDVTQNETILLYQDLTMMISYRSGTKTGMKYMIKKFVPLKEDTENITNVPVTRQSVASLAKNDTNC